MTVLVDPSGGSLVGRQAGSFHLTALLGAGGMGHVYRARDAALDRDVAVKVLPAIFSADRERIARFEREARTLARLNHPNIATIHGTLDEPTGSSGDRVRGLVLELVEGPTLAERLLTGALPLGEILALAVQIAAALEAAHERGIVHRDLKPANIKVTRGGVVKVLDFGLARICRDEGASADLSGDTLTAGGTGEHRVVGTAAYMSPEQMRGKAVDKRTDIWAFGCVLYECLTGRRAFAGDTISDSIAAVLGREPDWTCLPDGTPDVVRQLLAHCLDKDASRRLRDIGEARIALGDALAAGPRRQPVRAWAAGVLAVAVLAIGVGAIAGRPWRGREVVPLADPVAGKSRVAVLPFENLTHRPDDDWLAGAFADTLTFGFQPLTDVILVPREGVATLYRERSLREADRLDPQVVRELSRALDVRYYVHGSYQRVGDQLRVVAQLVDAATGTIKAQESATRDGPSLLQLEDDLARQMTAALDAGGIPQATPVGTSVLEAYRAVTEGRALYAAGDFPRAQVALKQAVVLDPQYALAWAELGKTYARLAAPGGFASGAISAYVTNAVAAAHRAVELQPSVYEGHVALALAYREERAIDSLRTEALRAIDLNPRMAEAYALMGDSYLVNPSWGCNREMDGARAERYYRQALGIDPMFQVAYSSLAIDLVTTGRADEALIVTTEGLRRLPASRLIRGAHGGILIGLGRYDEAESLIREAAGDRKPNVGEQIALAAIELKRGHLDAATRGFRDALAEYPHADYRIVIAARYFEAGRIAEAAEALESAFRIEPACAGLIARTRMPELTSFKNEPQIRALLARYGARP